MATILVERMAKSPRKGRPKRDEGDGKTKHVRVFDDLAEKIGWIVKVEGGSSAQLLDPIIRDHIDERYQAIKPTVDAIIRAMDKRRKTSPGEE